MEHYIEVSNIGDILGQLKKEYPKISYFRAVPVQVTLDYLLMQKHLSGQFLNGQSLYLKAAKHLSGQFLNGQSLYLKAAHRERSVDER